MHTAAVIESFWLRFVCLGSAMSHQYDMPPLPTSSDSPDSWPTVTFLQVAEDVTTWPNRPFCHSLMCSAVSFLAQWLWNTVVMIANVTATYSIAPKRTYRPCNMHGYKFVPLNGAIQEIHVSVVTSFYILLHIGESVWGTEITLWIIDKIMQPHQKELSVQTRSSLRTLMKKFAKQLCIQV